ncbi:ABC-F family ATP-binding cassette domain-containing protein [Desulfovibrio inopinatus]|uniref:ABC-F family ATP-binding cassette domain-containing protein n=1 Tax=Desulfovibrio inopinatus TaxID=102109 RepID=UPI0003FB4983|nr:ABC-F family ATP-binding cassette domain-containing protein [Desulfovibrio inopinatus]
MITLISLQNVSITFAAHPLFTDLSLGIGKQERVGLIGANGSGKSTLLGILAGHILPDTGERFVLRQARLAYLAQEDELDPTKTVEEIVAEPLHNEHVPAEELYTRVGIALGKAGFMDRTQHVDQLSGGWRKRLALARELVKGPDILLLDEPTNHLDLESILWLEELLLSLDCGYVVISHDRSFLENVTTRTIELGRGYADGYLSVDASYSRFLEKREEYRQGMVGYEQTLANKVRREIEWLRRGPKARSTKAKYRKDEAGRLQEELARTRRLTADTGKAGIDFTATDRKTKRLVVAEDISKTLGGKTLFNGLDVVLSPGSRLGLVGLNGSGKTTLLRTLAREIEPDTGTVSFAPNVQTVVFDQNREQLDTTVSLKQALSPHGDSVIYRDRPLHVVSWAKRFLFKPEQLPLPVAELSGGEQARVLIARLMLQPADILFLDEPTNNLDIETLEVLEESLVEFSGSIVLISHDRYFLDRVSTQLLGLDGHGNAIWYADYDQWDDERKARAKVKTKVKTGNTESKPAKAKPKKLSYKEQRELDGMEDAIFEAESELETVTAQLHDPAIACDAEKLPEIVAQHERAQAEVDRLYARWEELEAKRLELAGEG